MPGYLASTPGIAANSSRHAAIHITGREILVGLIVVVVAAALVVGPVLWGAAFDSFSSGMGKAAWPTLLTGFGVVIVGLASGVRIITIAGGALMAAVVVGVIAEKYLIFGLRPAPRGRRLQGAGATPAHPGTAGQPSAWISSVRPRPLCSVGLALSAELGPSISTMKW